VPFDAADPPLLRVRDLSILHDGNASPSPHGVSFDIRAGEVVLLLGPSGSGKSTLALALNGLIPHDIPAEVTGSVTVQGLDAAAVTPAELSSHISMVFQDPDAQLVTGTVLDEVAFGPENLLVPVEEVLARAERALRRVHLWHRRQDNPDTLSGGGRQRLAIACALAMGSPLMVLDEPTANLDPAGVEEVYALLAEIVAEGDRSILLVEHNLDEAIGFASRVIVLDAAGRIAFDGPTADVLREHAHDLAALGVWLPTPTLAGLHLREAGALPGELPLTAPALRAALPGVEPSSPATTMIASSDAIVDVSGLSVLRGGQHVLDDVSFRIPRGSFTAIVGGNGAGKTTLVQALAGVVRPPKGAIRIDGIDAGRASARVLAQHVGFVFQNPEHQFIAPTVYDELAYALRQLKLPESEVRERVDDVLARFGLADKGEIHPFLLSGGQKRRLSVGTALMSAAPVLVLDEPTFGQDRARAGELLDLLDELNAAGTTVVIVTHDMQLVADRATHVVVVHGGRVLTTGAAREVFGDDELLETTGLRLPALPAAVRAVPGYAHVWGMADLLSAAASGRRTGGEGTGGEGTGGGVAARGSRGSSVDMSLLPGMGPAHDGTGS
jgi:energy-coupling factor transport system ATP-binding protein